MKVTIETMYERLYEDEARQAILPGDDGEFSVWDFHQPSLHSLTNGWVRIIPRVVKPGVNPADAEYRLKIRRGIANIKSRTIVLVVEK